MTGRGPYGARSGLDLAALSAAVGRGSGRRPRGDKQARFAFKRVTSDRILNAGSPRVAHVESRLNLMHGHTVLINGGGSRTRTGGSCNVYKGFREYHGGSETKEGTPTPDPSRGSACADPSVASMLDCTPQGQCLAPLTRRLRSSGTCRWSGGCALNRNRHVHAI